MGLFKPKWQHKNPDKRIEGVKGLEDHKIYHNELLIKADTTKRICEGIETEHDLKECFDGMANFLIDDILRGDIMFKSYLEYEGHIKNK